jgi:hypothetical protein
MGVMGMLQIITKRKQTGRCQEMGLSESVFVSGCGVYGI